MTGSRVSAFVIIPFAAIIVVSSGTRAQVSPGSYSIASRVSDGIQNLRSGPGQGHPIVVAIPAGRRGVVIHECRPADDGRSRFQWCRAQWNGYSGWISSCCLVAESSPQPPPGVPPRVPAPGGSDPCDRFPTLC
jgi:uncharacterized protein YraI